MFNTRNDGFPQRTNNPPSPHIASLSEHVSDLHIEEGAETSAPSSSAPATDPCTICHDVCPSVFDRVTVPSCGHTFCLHCLVSWTLIRELCPNCKTPFSSLLVHRDLEGVPLSGPFTVDNQPPSTLQPTMMLRNLQWIQLTEIHSAKHDIEASFALPPINALAAPPQPSSSSAPHYSNEELEDELEHRFWEEEEKQYNHLMRSTKVVSNRRFGPQGYISGGRMRATPRPTPRTRKLLSASSAASGAQASFPNAAKSSGTGGRKKKVKKKSRAGIAAAKAAEAAAAKLEAEAAAASSSAEQSIDDGIAANTETGTALGAGTSSDA